jgi:hypothetical protein
MIALDFYYFLAFFAAAFLGAAFLAPFLGAASVVAFPILFTTFANLDFWLDAFFL